MHDAEPAALNKLEEVAEKGGGVCHFSEADAETLRKAIPVLRFVNAMGIIGIPLVKVMGWMAAAAMLFISISDWVTAHWDKRP